MDSHYVRFLLFCLVFLCMAIFHEAKAIVPLEEKVSLQLPPISNTLEKRLFDLQHCGNDTSFGYAFVSGDTIY